MGHLSEGQGFPCGAGGKERACQCTRCKRRRFNPWVGKIPGGVIRYLAGDKNLRIISGPNFTKIFLFKLISLVSCPQVTMCCASAVGYCQKDTLTKKKVKTTDALPLLLWLLLGIQEFQGGERLTSARLMRESFMRTFYLS